MNDEETLEQENEKLLNRIDDLEAEIEELKTPTEKIRPYREPDDIFDLQNGRINFSISMYALQGLDSSQRSHFLIEQMKTALQQADRKFGFSSLLP